jgi:hypothetical protein
MSAPDCKYGITNVPSGKECRAGKCSKDGIFCWNSVCLAWMSKDGLREDDGMFDFTDVDILQENSKK